MKITCTSCNATVPAENIYLAEKIAKCSACNSVFNCQEQLSSIADTKGGYQGFYNTKQDVLLPKNMTAGQVGLGYQLTIKWFSLKYIFLTIFCVIWDGAIAAFLFLILSGLDKQVAFFLSLHAIVGVGLTYYTIAGYLNTTIINIAGNQIDVKIVPLPWFGMKSITANGIEQLYCKQKITRGKNGTTITYEVHIKSADAGDIKLITGLEKEEQAFFIEQEIEKYLGIKDTPVPGEVTR